MTTARTHEVNSKFSPISGGHRPRVAAPKPDDYTPMAVDADGNLDELGATGEFEGDGDEGFDPADHTIDEVKTFVEENPDEAEAVLDLERDGKDRATLTAWLEGRDAAE